MPRFAIVKSGVVKNIVEATADFGTGKSWVPIPTGEVVKKGDQYVNDEFLSAPVSEEVPQIVTMRQGRLALHEAGLLASVDSIIASQTEDIKITWEYSSELERDNPMIESMKGLLGLTDQELDALFIAASKK